MTRKFPTLLALLLIYSCWLNCAVLACDTPSHSQSGEEDAVIQHFFHDQENGVYVEIGALDGVKFSNTLKLHKCYNWNGILVEGSTANFIALEENVKTTRPNAIIHHGAVCAPPQSTVKFATGNYPETSGDLDQMTESFKKTWVPNTPSVDLVPCHPMSKYLINHQRINFFSLDVEGAELIALETIDFTTTKIDVLLVELDQNDLMKNYRIRQYLFNMGYVECIGVVHRSGVFILSPDHYIGDSISAYKCPYETRTVAVPDASPP